MRFAPLINTSPQGRKNAMLRPMIAPFAPLRRLACGFGLALVALAPAGHGETRSCGLPVCLAARDSLGLAHVITFDDVQSALGLGHPIDEILIRPGARFGERFAGQILETNGDFDQISGAALAPLRAVPGVPGATLGAMRLPGTTVLQGHGPARFPRAEAVGEGAIAVEFDTDQGAFAFDLRGGENGTMTVIFLRRDGSEIARLRLANLSEENYGFLRSTGQADIAGVLILNDDPQGIAIDNLAFDSGQLTG